jgi:hypothetical protein
VVYGKKERENASQPTTLVLCGEDNVYPVMRRKTP